MNPTKRRTRLLFLARALREEADRMTGDTRQAMTHESLQLSHIYRPLERHDPATVTAFMDAAIDRIVTSASSRMGMPWQVTA